MKTAIETKFNIGDAVWFADYYYDTFYPCKYHGEIYEVNIEITKTQMLISYWMTVNYKNSREYEKYSECACFRSYEECAEWCDKRNKGEK